MGPFHEGWTQADVQAVLDRGDPHELLYVPIVISLDPPDCDWAERICTRLAAYPDATVRGNALVAFGHLARTCGRLNEAVVRPLIEAGLSDTDPTIWAHASDAADEIEQFLGWEF